MSFLTLHIYYTKIFIKNQKRYFFRHFQNFSKRKQKSGSSLHDLPLRDYLIVKRLPLLFISSPSRYHPMPCPEPSSGSFAWCSESVLQAQTASSFSFYLYPSGSSSFDFHHAFNVQSRDLRSFFSLHIILIDYSVCSVQNLLWCVTIQIHGRIILRNLSVKLFCH